MMKFFREHNRQILAVVVVFILISWLVGEPLRQLLTPDPSKMAIGTAFGKSITNGDLAASTGSTTILEALGMNWRVPSQTLLTREDALKPEHWYMLLAEARRSGVVVSPTELEEVITQRIPLEMLDAIRQRYSVSLDQIREAIGELLLIEGYASEAVDVCQPSDHEVRHFVRDTQDKIKCRMVAFKASEFVDPTEKIDPAEAAAQFEKYKNVTAADSPDGYGYKWPRRVRVEYIAARVEEAIPTITLNEEEVRRQYRKSKDQPDFETIEMKDLAADTQPTSGPMTQPALPRKELVRRPMTFEEARGKIEKSLKRKAAVSRIREVMQSASTELGKPWIGVPAGADGYKTAPAEVKAAAWMSEVKERLSKQYGMPLVFKQTELITEDDAGKDIGIGKAYTIGEGNDRLTFAEYAFRVPGFYDAKKAGDTALRLGLMQATDLPIYTEENGEPADQYIFRVIEVREPSTPVSLDEARSEVERDLRELHAFKRAEARAKEFFASARNGGLDEAYRLSTDLQEAKYGGQFVPRETQFFARRESIMMSGDRAKFLAAAISGGSTLEAPMISEVGVRSTDLVDRCFDMASPLWTPPVIEAGPTTRPTATAPADGKPAKVNFVALAKDKMAVVASLLDSQIVREDKYAEKDYQSGRQTLMVLRRLVLRTEWYRGKDIERRCEFVRAKTAEGEHVPVDPSRPEPVAPDHGL